MEDVERREDHYRQGGINSIHIPHRLLQRLLQRIMSIYIPPDDLGGAQGVQISEEPQTPQR